MPVRLRLAVVAGAAALVLPAAAAFAQNQVQWSLAPSDRAAAVKPGGTFTVTATATIEPGWHIYALSEPPGGPIPLSFKVPKDGPFSLAGTPKAVTPPVAKIDPNFDNLETELHEGTAVYTLPVRLAAGTAPGSYTLLVTTTFQTCNDRLCMPPRDVDLTLALVVGKDGTATFGGAGAPSTAAPETGAAPATGSGTAGAAPAPGPPVGESAAAARVPDMAVSSRASTLGAYILLAALMGALSLLTPCVFPMVPITVSYFTSRGGRSRSEAVTQALIYGLGIILTFTAVGFTLAVAFGASGLNRFAADPWLNLGVTALFVGFALSLFGVWEIALPSRLVTAASRAESGRGRIAGTLLMGLAFTLTSFTCTAPFLGTLLVVAAAGNWQWPLAGMIAFSTVFALPFILLALAPQVLASLPRSGPWMAAVKAVMGLLELAAAMKFLSNVDLVWNWGIFTRSVVLATWIGIAVVMVLYLAGRIRLGHAPRLGRPGPGRWAATAAAVVLGIWLATGLTGRGLGELEAFLPPADLTSGVELPWIVNDYEGALAQARQQNRRLLVDFTGYTCTNCRWMEANMFPRPDVARELGRYVRVRLYTDGQGEIYRRYQQLEQTMFGTVALPYYAVINPDGKPIVAFGGLTRDPAEYLAFLRKGLE